MPRTVKTQQPRAPERALAREFPLVCFDWGGTAVEHRGADAAAVRSRIERLTALGVDMAVMSGRDVGSVDGQLRARPAVEGRLFLFLSRGSEVYVVGPGGPRLLERRQASGDEEAQLSRAAEALRDDLAGQGLDAGVVTPPEPPQGRPGACLGSHARQRRCADQRAHVRRRLRRPASPACRRSSSSAHRLARDAGLGHPGIGSDGRHLEIGLTDKSDAARSVLRWLVQRARPRAAAMLCIGDDFGAGVDGGGNAPPRPCSSPSCAGAAFVSRRRGAGRRCRRACCALGGGPAAAARHPGRPDRAMRESVARGAFPSRRATRPGGSRSTASTPSASARSRRGSPWPTARPARAARSRRARPVSTPATFVAGVFGDGTGDPHFRQPVPAPDWTGLRLIVQGMRAEPDQRRDPGAPARARHGQRHRLSLLAAARPRSGRTRARAHRALRLAGRPRTSWPRAPRPRPRTSAGRLVWEGASACRTPAARLRRPSSRSLDEPGFVARTRGRNGGGHVLAVTTKPAPGSPVTRYLEQARDVIGGRLEPRRPGHRGPARGRSSRRAPRCRRPDDGAPAPWSVRRALGFDELLRRHRAAWRRRAGTTPTCVGRRRRRRPARPALRDLPHDQHRPPRARTRSRSAPAACRRHVLLPARVLGHRDLRAAVLHLHAPGDGAHAARLPLPQPRRRPPEGPRPGHKGALYPWESADKGIETTPPYGYRARAARWCPSSRGLMEHHISADVGLGHVGVLEGHRRRRVHGQHGRRDDARDGPLLGLAREPRPRWGATTSAWSWVRTSTTRAWTTTPTPTCWRAGTSSAPSTPAPGSDERDPAEAAELGERLALDGRRADRAGAASPTAGRRLRPGDPALRAVRRLLRHGRRDPVEKLRPRPMAADLLLGRDVTLVSKVVKQADVVMLCYVLPDEISDDVARANYDYYEPITSHGSSLRPGIHAAVAARLGDVQAGHRSTFKMAAGDRPRRQHGQRGPRPAHGHHGRPVAGGRDGFRRRACAAARRCARPAPAEGVEAGPRCPCDSAARAAPATCVRGRTASTWV